MRPLFRLILLLILCPTFSAFGAELGVVGPTYEITEPDLIEVIQARLKRMAATGELARKQREYQLCASSCANWWSGNWLILFAPAASRRAL